MRKVLLIILLAQGSFCFGQDQDSVQDQSDSLSMPAVPGQQMPQLKDGSSSTETVSIKIQREEVPVFLQKILQEEKYRGWENGGVYRNEEGSMFKVEVMDGMNHGTYYFDKDGTLLMTQ